MYRYETIQQTVNEKDLSRYTGVTQQETPVQETLVDFNQQALAESQVKHTSRSHSCLMTSSVYLSVHPSI